MTARLLLHWHLDEVLDTDGVLDASDNRLNGRPEGTPRHLPDDRFGSCLAFDGSGDAVTLADSPRLAFPDGYTVAAWFNPTARTAAPAGLVGAASKAFALTLGPDGAVSHRVAAGATMAASPPGAVRAGVWRHLAATCDGRTLRTFLDGVLVAERAIPANTWRGGKRDTFVVGRSASERSGWFDGRVAHVRLYDGPLTDAEIRQDMAEDEADLAAFVRSYPIDFDLSNQDQHHVLYIDDAPTGLPMTLSIRNASRQDVVFRPLDAAASDANHHLALRFRAQTLAATCRPAVSTPGWSSTRIGDTVYLVSTEPAALGPGAALALRLEGMNAAGGGGTRGTRVELGYRRLAFRGETDELTGSRIQFLDIVNHRGRTDLALRADLSGGNRVLSDGVTVNTLALRITNPSHDQPIRLVGTDESPDAASVLTVSLDVEHAMESREWALVTAAAAPATTLAVSRTSHPDTVPSSTWPQPTRDIGGQRVRWRIVAARSVTLPPTGWIEFTIGGIVAPPVLGRSVVSVGYANLPGYADGFSTADVEKSPLIYSAIQRIGIGTAAPQAKLHIVDVPADANAGTLILGPVEGANLRLGFARDHSWIQSHGARPLAINTMGNNVGIGTSTPGAQLTVKARENHLQLRRDEATPAGNRLFLELFQSTPATQPVYPSIRFHHANTFWHRIEARTDGFFLKTGDLARDDLINLYANAGTFASATVAGDLSVHGYTLNERNIEILSTLINGELEVDLFSFAQNRSLGRVTLQLVNR